MNTTWRKGEIQLVAGYTVALADGSQTAVATAEFAIEGGYVHLRIPGTAEVQIVSAPAVRRITYVPEP